MNYIVNCQNNLYATNFLRSLFLKIQKFKNSQHHKFLKFNKLLILKILIRHKKMFVFSNILILGFWNFWMNNLRNFEFWNFLI